MWTAWRVELLPQDGSVTLLLPLFELPLGGFCLQNPGTHGMGEDYSRLSCRYNWNSVTNMWEREREWMKMWPGIGSTLQEINGGGPHLSAMHGYFWEKLEQACPRCNWDIAPLGITPLPTRYALQNLVVQETQREIAGLWRMLQIGYNGATDKQWR